MAQTRLSIATILEQFREFDRIATTLDMPQHERLNILNTTDGVYGALAMGMRSSDKVTPELNRRLSYALPTMRRLVMTATVDTAPAQMHAA